MSTSATLPSTIQIRPSRLAGLLAAVAILGGVTTWSVSQVTTESHARSSLQSDVVPSPGFATMGYERRRHRPHPGPAGGHLRERVPEPIAAASRGRSQLGINLDDFDKAEQDFLIALAAAGAGGPSPAIGGAGTFIPFTPPKS